MVRRSAAAVLFSGLFGLSCLLGAGAAWADAGVGPDPDRDSPAPAAVAGATTPEVVVLASYHAGDSWTDNELAGLLAGLKTADPDLVPAVEYLDTKRFPGPAQLTFLADTLVRKYRDRSVDLVVALDNPAFDLLRTHAAELFPGVPVVFAGVNGFQPEWLHERPKTTGVAEVEDIAGTLDLALRLHPSVRRVLVVADDTASGRAVRRDLEAILPRFRDRAAVDFAPALPVPELARQLAALPADSLVLILTYVTDAAGRVLSREESTRLITAASPVPVYAMHATRLGYGIVGGLLLDGREHGTQAAALVARVLAGADPALIPVEHNRSYPQFDEVALRRFHIAAATLPPDSRIINRRVTFYSQHRELVQGALAVLTLLSLAVLLLTVAVLRARRAEARMRASEERYRTLFETMPQGVAYQELQAGITAANPAAQRILGLSLDQLQGRGSIDPRWHAIHEDGSDFPGAEHPAMVALRTGREVPGTLMGIFNPVLDGYRWLVVHARPQFRAGEDSPRQVVVTFDDLTDLRAAEAALHRTQERLDLAVEGGNLGLYDADLRTGAVRVNDSYARILGYAAGELDVTERGWWERIHPADRSLVERLSAAVRSRQQEVFEAEYRLRHRSGHWLWVLDRGRGFDWGVDGQPGRGAGTIIDITERKEAEERILRLSRLYQTLSDTNQAIVRTADETDLFRQVCDIGLRLAGFGLVWIGLADRARNRLIPVAAAGEQADALRALEFSLEPPPPPGSTLAVAALAAGRALVNNDWGGEQPVDGGTQPSVLRGLGAVAALPLSRGGQPVGVLEVGAPAPGYFDAEVVALLEEMAQDLAYALDNLERVRALAESQAQYRRMVETAGEGIWSMDAEHRTNFVNRRMADLLGYAPEEMLGQPVEAFVFPADRADHATQMQGRMRGQSDRYERRFRRRDGGTLWAIVAGAPIMDEAGAFRGSFGMFTDITERKSADERMAAQKSFYEDILERVQEGIFATDAQQLITYANQSMARISGLPVADFVGRHALESFAPETVGELRPLFHQALESRTPTPWELHLVTPAGREAWQAGWLLPRFGAAGYAGMICTVRDVTAERVALRALDQYRAGLEDTVAARTAALGAAEEELRLILESSANGLCGLAPDGTLSFANPAACRLLGYPAEQLVGAVMHTLVHHTRPDGSPYPPTQCPLRATLREGQMVTVDDEVFWRADGQPIPVIYSAHPMVRDGAIVGAVVSFVDITERRRLEERLRCLAGAVECIIGVRDRAGLAAIVASAARDLIAADGAALVLRDGAACDYLDAGVGDTVWQGARFPLEGGAAGWVIRHAEPLTLEDSVGDPRCPPELRPAAPVRGLCLVPVGRISPLGAVACYWSQPHHTTEQELGLAQALAHAVAVGLANLDLIGRLTEARVEAERLAQVKSLFLANMSHEIRTPMNAIVGFAHLLRRGARDPDQQDKLGKITAAANHLLAILNDILDFSKIEAGKLELDECDFDLTAVLRRACTLVAEQVRAKGLELALHLDPALAASPGLHGDPTRLTQLLLNYLVNAVKFTEHGTIALEASVCEEGPATRLLRFAVRDTGIGIDPADQGRLFDAFEQLDASTTRRHGGTGLGLAINRRLAQLMGGAVGVDTALGAGSTFWFTARLGRGAQVPSGAERWPPPVASAADATDVAELALRRGHRGARVLLAEDNPINQEVALELLRGAGLQADLAADGAQALTLAGETPYDLILMDVQMPVLDGLEATQLIRRLPGYADTPILAMTANAFSEDRARCLAAGMNDHVGKPVEPDVLFSALLKWLPPRGATAELELGPAAVPVAGPAPTLAPTADAPLGRLAAIPGLDIALALRSVAGRADRLVRVLRVFVDSARDDPTRLRACLDAADPAGAQRLAHGLKGAAATLGATAVCAQALALELALREGRPRAEIDPLIDALAGTLGDLLAAIREAL